MRTKWWHNGPKNGISVPIYSGTGACVHAATVESADVIVALLNGDANVVDHMRDTLERIAVEYPAAVEMCDCGDKSGYACSKCEIAFLLKEWTPEELPVS